MSRTRDGSVRPIMALAVVAALGACAQTKQVSMEQSPPASAVLPEPALLKKGTSGAVDQVYLNPSADWAAYTKVMLDPVTIWTGPGFDMAKASPKEQKALADAFYTELHDAVAKRCQMVTEPSPGTMRRHIALVDATSANPFLNTLSTYEPQHVHLLDVAAGYAFNDGVAYRVGEATAEGYARDTTTGTLLWERADERAGTKAFGPGYLQRLGRRRQRVQGVGRAVRHQTCRAGGLPAVATHCARIFRDQSSSIQGGGDRR